MMLDSKFRKSFSLYNLNVHAYAHTENTFISSSSTNVLIVKLIKIILDLKCITVTQLIYRYH